MSNSKVGDAFRVDNTSGEVASRSIGAKALLAAVAAAEVRVKVEGLEDGLRQPEVFETKIVVGLRHENSHS